MPLDPPITPSTPTMPAATNTVLLTNLSRDAFTPNFTQFLRNVASKYGLVRRVSPLRSFGRCLVTYARTEDAVRAHEGLEDDLEASGVENVRVYFADYVRIEDDGEKYLQVPHLERNFLLSPPGSPPVGWVQGFEAAPNANTHHPELFNALLELEADQFTLDQDGGAERDADSQSEGTAGASPSQTDTPAPPQLLRLTITPRAPGEDPDLASPVAVRVEDWGSADHHALSAAELANDERRNIDLRHHIEQDMARFYSAQQPPVVASGHFGGVDARRHRDMPRTAMPPVSRNV